MWAGRLAVEGFIKCLGVVYPRQVKRSIPKSGKSHSRTKNFTEKLSLRNVEGVHNTKGGILINS